jgi:hypothetical protein
VVFKEDRTLHSATDCGRGGRPPTLLCAAVLCGISARRRVQSIGCGRGGRSGARAQETEVGEFGMTTGRTENHGWQLWVHTTLGWNRGQTKRWGKRVTQYVTCPASRSRGQFIRYIKKISSAEAIWPKEKEIRFMRHCRLSYDYVRLDHCITAWPVKLTLPALVSKIVTERGTRRKHILCP